MKKTLGILGFIILIISGVFLDTPIIAILVMPLFLVGFAFLLIFYLGFKKSQSLFSTFIIVMGTVLLCGLLGYSVVEYNQFQVDVDRNIISELAFNWSKILVIVVLNVIASLLIYLGIQKSNKLNKTNLFLVWLPTLILIPFTLFLIKLAILTGFWLGG